MSARPDSAAAQDAPGWNDAATLRVVGAAIEARRTGRDNDLERYQAYAEGQVVYLAEYGEGSGDQVVRSDRVALELNWRRRVGSLQTILGRRDVSWMPTSIRYHIDHLSLVLENFGDRIRIGDGDEVRDVLNPVAPGAPEMYEYRLVDSLSMYVNGRLTELYRLQVRPLRADSAAVVGTLDVERSSFAVVRLAVSFTPASYVDPTVRSVSVDLQNALVANRAWLPAAQHTEVRRQMRYLDMPFGGTIRTRFEVLSWDLDPPKDMWVPIGHRVRRVDDRDLARYAGWRTDEPFGEPDRLMADSALFEAIRAEATRVVSGRYLGGTGRLRLNVPSISSVLRVRRAEGVFAGLGARFDVDGRTSLVAHGGYAFGSGDAQLSGGVRTRVGRVRLAASGFSNRVSDAGPWSAAAGAVASGSAAIIGEDFQTPFVESGGDVSAALPVGGGIGTLTLATSRHEAATLNLDPLSTSEPRPIGFANEGRDTRAQVAWNRQLAPLADSKLALDASVAVAATGTFDYTRWVSELVATPTVPDATWAWEGRAGLAVVTGDPPPQRGVHAGGRGTVPGYPIRGFVGTRGGFAHVVLSRNLAHPWVRMRLIGAAGWVGGELPVRDVDDGSRFDGSDGLRPAAGGGLSFLYDIVRLDAVRGLDGGEWEWMISVNPKFRAPL